MPIFPKKQQKTLFLMIILAVSPIAYYHYRSDIISYEKQLFQGKETKGKKDIEKGY